MGLATLLGSVALTETSMGNQVHLNSAIDDSYKIESQKINEDLNPVLKSDGSVEITNVGNDNSTVVNVEMLDGNTSVLSRLYGKNLTHPNTLSSLTIVENRDVEISPNTIYQILPPGSVNATANLAGYVLTSYGNRFDLVNQVQGSNAGDTTYNTYNSNATKTINGMGLYSRIVNYDYVGKIPHGYGVVGTEDSLKPYTLVPSITNYAAQLLDTDSRTAITIPKFNTEYNHVSGALQDIGSTIPNILSYSQSRTVAGSGTVTQTSNEITFSGTGQIIVKLNDLGANSITFEGTVPSGGRLRVTEKLGTYDLMTLPYTGSFQIGSGTGSWQNIQTAMWWGDGRARGACGQYVWYYSGYTAYSASPNLDVSASSNFASNPSYPISSGTQYSNYYHANSLYYQSGGFGACSPIGGSGTFLITYYDNDPTITLRTYAGGFTGQTFQTTAGKQYYLIAEPNGGTFTITGTAYTPSAPYLQITSMPANIPYEIIKNGYVTASGMTPASGPLTLMPTDVDIYNPTSSAALYLYLNSLAYRGSFSTVVFDNVNGQTIHIATPDDKVYVVHAYVQIPVVGSVTITNTYLDNSLALPYLNGNYTNGQTIMVPVIPGYHDINMEINGIPTITSIASVLGGTGVKVASPSTQTINDSDTDSALPYIESTTGTVAYVVSTSSGSISASIQATISGSSSL
ncbi:MAG: hypothetical protein HZA84_01700, partial [Thaumarchaeota archaeon]|nr:hypothetical protein [Nitrososphaerota archaeon]